MHDQADDLRQLVLRTAASARAPSAPPPPLVAVAGGKRGVGTSTIAVNVTVALARLGRRAVLVDADLHAAGATRLTGIRDGDCVTDVLRGRRTVHEVLQPGPAGILVLPGVHAGGAQDDFSAAAQQRMLDELARLGPHSDVILLDAGNETDDATARFWEAADLVVLVTSGDPAAVMDSYATIKLLGRRRARPIHICVTQVPDDATAADVFARLQQACRRFLNIDLEPMPSVLLEGEVAAAGGRQRPFVLEAPHLAASRCTDAMAEQLLVSLEELRQSATSNNEAA